MRAEVVELVKVQYMRGDGTKEDRAREVTALFAKNGDLVAEVDVWRDAVAEAHKARANSLEKLLNEERMKKLHGFMVPKRGDNVRLISLFPDFAGTFTEADIGKVFQVDYIGTCFNRPLNQAPATDVDDWKNWTVCAVGVIKNGSTWLVPLECFEEVV